MGSVSTDISVALTNKLLVSPLLDQTDTPLIIWFGREVFFWCQDARALLERQPDLESAAIYLTDKYASLARREANIADELYYDKVKHFRQGGHKGEGLVALVESDPEYKLAKYRKAESQALADLFDKLSWAVVRKDNRIQSQRSLYPRT